MHRPDIKTIADRERGQIVKDIIDRWKARTPKQKAIDIGSVTALFATLGWMAWPDLHAELEDWNPNYQNSCYTHDADADGLSAPEPYYYAQDMYSVLDAAGPYGTNVITDFDQNLERRVLCLGEPTNGENTERWVLTGVTIVNPDYSPLSYSFRLAAHEYSSYWGDHVEDMEDNLVYRDALLFSRFERAIEATEQVNMFFQMAHEQHGNRVFESAEWQSIVNSQHYGRTATAFQNAYLDLMRSYDLDTIVRPTTNADFARIMNEAFIIFMQDGDALNTGDLEFMRRYHAQMEDSEEECYGTGEDRTCYWVDTAPPSWVHSRRINGEIISQLTRLTYPEGQSWIDPIDAEGLMRDPAFTALHSQDAINYEERIARRIQRWHTERHDTHRPITTDKLINGYGISQYHQNTADRARPLPRRY